MTAIVLAATLGIAGTAGQVDVEAATGPVQVIADAQPVIAAAASSAERITIALNQSGGPEGRSMRATPAAPAVGRVGIDTGNAAQADTAGDSISDGQLAMVAALMALIVVVRRRDATRKL
ncbi:MAG: hypothetical protein AB7P21_13295 [Lautropia sp.]